MTWTQAVCDHCFAELYPGRQPARFKEPEPEQCCRCGAETLSGIYIRIDPSTVRYPRAEP